MFTLPKSNMTTILLWGDRWWLPHHKLPVPFADLAQAADQLSAAWPGSNRTLRLIYQPDEFATVPVQCPNGNRATLALALGEEHPVVHHPGHVWSFEPIHASGDSFGTLLHYETRPILFGLVHRLRELGFTVSSVWPMGTWLNALPPDLSPSGAMTVCAIHSDRFCLYRQSADGGRALRAGHDGNILQAVSTHLAGLPTKAETEFVLYVTTDDALVERLTERVPLDDRQILGIFSMSQALAKPAVIPARHPAQLLPPVPLITAPKMISIVSAVCLFAAIGLAVTPVRAWINHHQNEAINRQERLTLSSDIEILKPQVAELKRRQSEQLADGPDPLPWVELLRTLPNALPPQVVLTRFQADRSGFQIHGGVSNGLADVSWERWQQSLQSHAGRWRLNETAVTKPTSTFEIKGQWQ